MLVQFDPHVIVAFLLAMVRAVAWMMTSPPFSRGFVPVQVRVGLAVGLGAFLAGQVDATEVGLGIGSLTFAIAYQILIGLALGFIVQVFFAAFQAAGSLVDVASGFSAGSLYDPLTGSQNATVGRLYELLATVLVFVGGGHVLIVGGFLRTFEAAPLAGPSISEIAELLMHGIGTFLVAAIEIAFPLAAALMMTEVALALLARASPQSNVLMLGMSVKALVVLVLLGLSIAVVPAAVELVLSDSVRLAFGSW